MIPLFTDDDVEAVIKAASYVNNETAQEFVRDVMKEAAPRIAANVLRELETMSLAMPDDFYEHRSELLFLQNVRGMIEAYARERGVEA